MRYSVVSVGDIYWDSANRVGFWGYHHEGQLYSAADEKIKILTLSILVGIVTAGVGGVLLANYLVCRSICWQIGRLPAPQHHGQPSPLPQLTDSDAPAAAGAEQQSAPWSSRSPGDETHNTVSAAVEDLPDGFTRTLEEPCQPSAIEVADAKIGGIQNSSSSCFLNATLQAMMRIKSFRKALEGLDDDIARQITAIIKRARAGQMVAGDDVSTLRRLLHEAGCPIALRGTGKTDDVVEALDALYRIGPGQYQYDDFMSSGEPYILLNPFVRGTTPIKDQLDDLTMEAFPPFLLVKATSVKKCASEEIQRFIEVKDSQRETSQGYCLRAMVIHNQWHATAFVYSGKRDRWHYIDDSAVQRDTPPTGADILNLDFLFYEATAWSR